MQPVDEIDTIDEILNALADHHRRLLLQYLRKKPNETATYTDLVKHIDKRTSDDREEIRTCLHHVALPTLVDVDLIEYDPRSETVVYQPDPVVEDVLDYLKHRESFL